MGCYDMNMPFIATVDQSSAAFQVGEYLGIGFAICLMVAIPVFFIYALVKYFKTKNAGWLVGAMIAGIPVALFVGAFCLGFYRGMVNASGYVDETQEIPAERILTTGDGRLQLEVPEHWKLLQDLNEVATLQVGNPYREEYLITISAPKEDYAGDLAQQADLTVDRLLESLSDFDTGDYTELEINGLNAVQFVVSGTIDNIQICYLITILEEAETFQQVYCWTLPSKKEKAFSVFRSVLGTIRAAESAPAGAAVQDS